VKPLALAAARSRTGARVLLATFASIALLADAMFAANALAATGDKAAGRRKAVQCQACHGLDGMSKLPNAPNIAGQPEAYLVKSLDEFRKGVRKNDMMSLVAPNLSDQDIADLAAYYAAIEVTVKAPQ
jgi:cytochrome c553